ncbi:SDR family NAD(P)-dependent oxidoreductase [Prosthecochloris sp.]|uniref:SDR family NAD(P)-dependent oxidoreductase n=1 Tax=Prosthecochloris sp. TaxID=290513 RepID=UPI0025F711E7|nr:SDR family NAD(P)-dependent oxidoreductase [Prosthecochloris sp.]
MNDISGKVVLVTGAAGALGTVVSKKFFDKGAAVALFDKHIDLLANQWQDQERVMYQEVDLTRVSSVETSVGRVMERFGRIDALVNIAGGFTMGHLVHEAAEETWDYMLDLNAKSVFLMTKAVIPFMRKQKRGSVVNVSAKTAVKGGTGIAPYVVSKSAVIKLTECLAEENRQAGINVNCVLPSIIDTPANRKDMPDADFSLWVSPEAIADVILFLVSQESRAVHGASIPVYGLS